MEKIKLSTDTGSRAEMVSNFWRIEEQLKQISKWINAHEQGGGGSGRGEGTPS